jgi:hypothetical protein
MQVMQSLSRPCLSGLPGEMQLRACGVCRPSDMDAGSRRCSETLPDMKKAPHMLRRHPIHQSDRSISYVVQAS